MPGGTFPITLNHLLYSQNEEKVPKNFKTFKQWKNKRGNKNILPINQPQARQIGSCSRGIQSGCLLLKA